MICGFRTGKSTFGNIMNKKRRVKRDYAFSHVFFYSSSRNTRDFSRGIRAQKSETRFIAQNAQARLETR
jgi:hypothetical protein